MGFLWHRAPTPGPLLPAPAPPHNPPFVVEDRLEDVKRSGEFTPRAVLWLSPSLGESGLLCELSSAELHLLLGVLACLTPNGTFLATAGRVAGVLGLPHRVARQGLEALCERHWRGSPLLRTHLTETGMRFFVPSFHLLETRSSVIAPTPSGGQRVQAPQQQPQQARSNSGDEGSARERVIAYSRAHYARPRADVEAEIAAFLASGRAGRSLSPVPTDPTTFVPTTLGLPKDISHAEPPTTPEAREWLVLKRALGAVGVPDHRADELLDTYPPARIRRQLEWLPLRQARSPVAYLMAAIEKDYQAPPGAQRPSPGNTNPPSSAQEEHDN